MTYRGDFWTFVAVFEWISFSEIPNDVNFGQFADFVAEK